jgi:Transposase DDE domain
MCIIVGMHVARASWLSTNRKTYQSIYLRESFRVGDKVHKRNIANLTHCDPKEIAAIELALKHKGDLTALSAVTDLQIRQGPSVGAVWTLYQVACRLGIDRALGADFAGQLGLWQVLARVLDQGSRLSATRLAQVHAACDVLGIRRGFDENDLYENLGWLSQNQPQIEQRLFVLRYAKQKPQLFLYDVTSSYLEGDQNDYGAYGYNRDGKKGKKQIVIGLLCDGNGDPLSSQVFHGNTQDPKTFTEQITKASQSFGCQEVTFVGDRGMIKSGQIEQLTKVGFHYITAITKPQIDTLLASGVLQLDLFASEVCQIEQDSVRYVLRRNPMRAEQMAGSRSDKRARIEKLVEGLNNYLDQHPKAKPENAQMRLHHKIVQLKIDSWLTVGCDGRMLTLQTDAEALEQASRLDGCYVLKTDLPTSAASAQIVHDRYKDLTQVEMAFRTCKTTHLETRPIYVRTAEHTRGHVLVVMLAYMIRRTLSKAWASFDLTVEEGLHQLQTLCAMELIMEGTGNCLRIPAPSDSNKALLKALDVSLPDVLPHLKTSVVTRRKLPQRRKLA